MRYRAVLLFDVGTTGTGHVVWCWYYRAVLLFDVGTTGTGQYCCLMLVLQVQGMLF